MGAETVT
jgi:calcium/calmodulin-dependent protein kinase I